MEDLLSAYLTEEEEGEEEDFPSVTSSVFCYERIGTTHGSSIEEGPIHGGPGRRIQQAAHLHPLPLIPEKKIKGYVSKRKRKLQDELNSSASATTDIVSPSILSPYHLSSSTEISSKKPKFHSSLPKRCTQVLSGHSKPVLSMEWHPVDHRLLISAGLDGMVKLWDLDKKVVVGTYDGFHGGEPVRDVEWVTSETAITAGYDCYAVYFDAGCRKEIVRFKHEAFVSVLKPSGVSQILTGDNDGRLKLWDLRTAKVIKEYKGAGGKILDAVFLPQQDAFVASSDIVKKNAFSQAMNVWDIRSGVTLTHQLYFEPFTCPCLRVHSGRNEFLAQSNGNYVIIFTATKPFKLNKYKRFQGHAVSGFDVKFDLNPDRDLLCSASSEGKVHFYSYDTCRSVRTLGLSDSACLDVKWCPNQHSQVAVSDWKGRIHIVN